MEYSEVVMKRYATKKFDGRIADEGKIRQLLEIIRNTPSGLDLQPWKIKMITDQETKEKLLPHTHGQPQVTTCSHLLVFCADTDFEGLLDRLEQYIGKPGVPAGLIRHFVDMGRGMVAGMTAEQRLSMAQSHVYMALVNAVNGAKALGLDSCPIGGFEPAAYAQILNLPPHLVPTALCPVGYAADTPVPKIRFPLEEILI